jgi:hypothetical protein
LRLLHPALADIDIRPALRAEVLSSVAKNDDVAVFEELGICRGRVRVDLAVVNGTLDGYEIKSDRDSLRRLGAQIDFYSRVLDRATLVVGERHLTDAVAVLPSWWGILRVEPTPGRPRFGVVREGRVNPERNPRALAELLWLDDALALLERCGAARGVKGKPRRLVWDRVCERCEVEEIGEAVRTSLKARVARQVPRPPS